jgi:hypothetical protein
VFPTLFGSTRYAKTVDGQQVSDVASQFAEQKNERSKNGVVTRSNKGLHALQPLSKNGS